MSCPGCHLQFNGVKFLRQHFVMKPGHVQAKGLSKEEFARVIEAEVQRQKQRSYYSKNLVKSQEKEREKKKKARLTRKEGRYGPIFRYSFY